MGQNKQTDGKEPKNCRRHRKRRRGQLLKKLRIPNKITKLEGKRCVQRTCRVKRESKIK